MRQRSIRVVEIDSFEELIKLESKLPLLKNHYFLLKEKNNKIEEFLKSRGFNYFVVNEVSEVVKVEKVVEKKEVIEVKKDDKIFSKVIRSGEEVVIDSNALFLDRINPGARVVVNGNAIFLAENLGEIIVNGEYLIIKKNSARAIFNNEDIGKIDKLTVFTKDYKKVIE